MSEPETRSVELRRAQRFQLGATDMEEAAAAAKWLAGNALPRDVARVFETGIVVVYARPFTEQGVGRIDPTKYGPADADARKLHDWLLYLRKRLYAHTDKTSLRFVAENVRDLFGLPVSLLGIDPGSAVETRAETLAMPELEAIAALATAQAERFRQQALLDRAASPEKGLPSSRRLTFGGIAPSEKISSDEPHHSEERP